MKAYKLAKVIVTIDRLTNDYKQSGCGTCKRIAKELNLKLIKDAYNILLDYENKTKTGIK
jgi:hypothetical protein